MKAIFHFASFPHMKTLSLLPDVLVICNKIQHQGVIAGMQLLEKYIEKLLGQSLLFD